MPNMSKYKTEDFPKNLSITIGSRHSFKNFAKIGEWFAGETAFWNSIGNPNNMTDTFTNQIKNQINSRFNQNQPEEIEVEQFLEELKNHIENTFTTFGLISSKSKRGKWLKNLHEKNPTLVKGAVTYFQHKIKNISNNQITLRDGEFAAYLFDNKIEPDFDTEKQQYEDFYAAIVKQKDEILKELIDIREENKNLNAIVQKQNKDWEATFTTQKKAIAERFDNEYQRHHDKMTESEEFYEEKLAVKSAVIYWSRKAASHKKNSFIFGTISFLLMIASIISIYIMGRYIVGLDLSVENGTGSKILTENGALQLWVYGFFLISISLAIWIIRLMVKVFLSNLHLLSDANERETMIKTYLAFEREEKTLKDTDRDLILPSIFRVSSNGFIKDDSSPNTPLNIITKKFTQ
jgi:Family of unknown function (DUF6161)